MYDEATIRSRAGAYTRSLQAAYPGASRVCYAAKAYCAPWLLRLLADEGLGLDVVSGGELYVARASGFPRERIYFHGNNKSEDELWLALDIGVHRVVVDNLEEVERLSTSGNGAAEDAGRPAARRARRGGAHARAHRHRRRRHQVRRQHSDRRRRRGAHAPSSGPGPEAASACTRTSAPRCSRSSRTSRPSSASCSCAARLRDAFGFKLEEFSPAAASACATRQTIPSRLLRRIATRALADALCAVGTAARVRDRAAEHDHRAGALDRRAVGGRAVPGRLDQAHRRRAHVRGSRRRHGRQHPTRDLRRALHGAACQPRRRTTD